MNNNDPIGSAIWDFYEKKEPLDITVESDITEDDVLPINHLFREFDDFPKLEQKAMSFCRGKILDVGAGAGPHTKYLLSKGFDVTTLEISPKAHSYLKASFPAAKHYSSSILEFNQEQYDTILLLMNGIGLAGTFNEVVPFLQHVASLLKPGGIIICDSTDVQNVFQDEDGGLWVDLNSNYYGEFKFNMKYKESESDWFNWVYIDVKTFEEAAEKAGLQLIYLDDDENSFLVKLKKMI